MSVPFAKKRTPGQGIFATARRRECANSGRSHIPLSYFCLTAGASAAMLELLNRRDLAVGAGTQGRVKAIYEQTWTVASGPSLLRDRPRGYAYISTIEVYTGVIAESVPNRTLRN
jgi:hypothetical protein